MKKQISNFLDNKVCEIFLVIIIIVNRLINNITEIIGEDEVMSKVRFIYQHDTKRGILIPQEKELLVTT